MLRRARYATYAVTRCLIDVCRANGSLDDLRESLSLSLSLTAASILLTGALECPWDAIPLALVPEVSSKFIIYDQIFEHHDPICPILHAALHVA